MYKKSKLMFLFCILFFLAFAVSGTTHGVEMDEWDKMSDIFSELGISQEDLDDLKDIIDDRAEPYVHDVSATPEEPLENEPVKITARVDTALNSYGDDIFEVYVNYSTDGGESFSRIDMERSDAGSGVWEGIIPGQPSGTEVIYGIQAVNVYDEVFVEAVCQTENGFRGLDETALEDCMGQRSEKKCISSRPVECMFPMSFSLRSRESFDGDTKKEISDELFIESTRVGFNEEQVFMEMDMKSRVSSGTLSPMDANIYIGGWVNPDKGTGETGIEAVLKQGSIVLYAPLNTSNKCSLYFFRGAAVESDTQSVTCDPRQDRLVLSVDRRAIGNNPGRTLEFIFITFNMTQYTPPDVELADVTLLTRVTFADRYYFVE